MKAFVVGFGLKALLGVGGLVVAALKDAGSENLYITAPVERGDLVTTITATGTVNAVVTVMSPATSAFGSPEGPELLSTAAAASGSSSCPCCSSRSGLVRIAVQSPFRSWKPLIRPDGGRQLPELPVASRRATAHL